MRIAMVAGEPSGDVLAAGLIKQIKARIPNASFYGIGGERMQAQGFEAIYGMESIALMGIESVLKDIRTILSIRNKLKQLIKDNPPDCFIGVDVPDFNLSLERHLRQHQIKVIHYVSPSVWAWRGYRLKKIKLAVDHMLTLFPFEKHFYDQHGIAATFIGHPTADKAVAIRQAADVSQRDNTIAILPGSRRAEVAGLLPEMLKAAKLLHQRFPQLQFVLPFASQKLLNQYQAMVECSGLPIEISLQGSGQALARSKLSLIASGTAALEAMIYGSVMVVVYKVGKLSEWMFRCLKHVDYFSLPNHLLAKPEIPELSQAEVTAENIAQHAIEFLEHPEMIQRLAQEFEHITQSLHKNTDELAAKTVLSVMGRSKA